MPGPVSDSYDPEWGTSSNREDIADALAEMHGRLGEVIGGGPKFVLEPVHEFIEEVAGKPSTRTLTLCCSEAAMRILRFACERARENL